MGTAQKVARLTPFPEMAFISLLGDKTVGLRNHKSQLHGHFYVLIAKKKNHHLRLIPSKIQGSQELVHRPKEYFTKLSQCLEMNSGFGTM